MKIVKRTHFQVAGCQYRQPVREPDCPQSKFLGDPLGTRHAPASVETLKTRPCVGQRANLYELLHFIKSTMSLHKIYVFHTLCIHERDMAGQVRCRLAMCAITERLHFNLLSQNLQFNLRSPPCRFWRLSRLDFETNASLHISTFEWFRLLCPVLDSNVIFTSRWKLKGLCTPRAL